jgi:hypothetical protein
MCRIRNRSKIKNEGKEQTASSIRLQARDTKKAFTVRTVLLEIKIKQANRITGLQIAEIKHRSPITTST